MSLGTANRDGGKTSESGHLRPLPKIVYGDIIEGLQSSQRSAGANMSIDIAVGDAFVRRSDGSYAHPVFNDAVYNQVISAADGSNPRRDIVVIYVDYGVAPVTTVSNNINGVVKIKVVNGTPAGSPVDPTDSAIQASVGAGNPYTKLSRVRVPAGQTSISNTLIDDLRTVITPKMDVATKNAWLGGGWFDANETWAFSSWNSTTNVGVITAPSDATTKYFEGQFIRIAQPTGGTKYGLILTVTSTSISVWMPGYTLTNEAITVPFYSPTAHPTGLPVTIAEGNPYKYSGWRNANASINGTDTVVAMDVADFNTLSLYNPANGLFTAPKPGYYQIQGQITGTANTTYMWATIQVNGVTRRRGTRYSNSPSSQHAGFGLIFLNTGDTLGFGGATGNNNALEAANRYLNYVDIYLYSRG